jgi:RND superfamily putative drug exporter
MKTASSNGGSRKNIAGRAGAWSARHWKRATFGWLAFAVAAIFVGFAAGAREISDSDMASGETARALQILEDAGFQEPATESVLVQNPRLDVGNPRFQSAVGQVSQFLALRPEVTEIQNPFAAGQISNDGHSVLVQFDTVGDADEAEGKIDPILAGVAAIEKTRPGFVIEEFGQASAERVLGKAMEDDFRRAETLSVPVTLVILVIAFGALVAAGLPVLLAFSAVLASVGLSQLVSHLIPTADATQSVILLMGMAVGVDYSLFYLRREREERARGREPHAALLRTAATSGQAVLVSGATVLIAMAGMLLAGNAIFTSIGMGTMIVIFAAMVGSLTVLPAVLHKLGDRVEKGRVPLVGRFRRPAGESHVWAALVGRALRRPLVSAIASAAVLLAAAVPVLGMHTKLPSFTDLPKSLPTVETFERIQKAFPGSQMPVEVVVRADNVTTPRYTKAYEQFKRRALATGLLYQPFHVHVSRDETVARIEFAIAGTGDDEKSIAALNTLRDDVIPPVAATLPDTEVAVSGQTAGTTDFNELMKQRAPLVFAFVLGLAFLLLLLTFRSLVVPLKAIVLNLLSVGAAYGILIMVFQWGNLEGLLGFESNGAITSWLPLFLFVVLFGLSMDYHVFILSRIKELVDRGMRTDEAVERGIRTTAGTVTAAAVVMVAVFGIFVSLRSLDVKQMGFGLAVAVLIDATIIRAVLLPATMKLLGEWNWYLPRWLEWLPRLGPEGRPAELALAEASLPVPLTSPVEASAEPPVRSRPLERVR